MTHRLIALAVPPQIDYGAKALSDKLPEVMFARLPADGHALAQLDQGISLIKLGLIEP